MLFEGQPITAHCGSEYLCIVKQPHGESIAIVDAIAIIRPDDSLDILEEPLRQDWYLDIGDGLIERAERLYLDYLEITGKGGSHNFSKDEIKQYSIKGRMM